jgi:hypothetical protein
VSYILCKGTMKGFLRHLSYLSEELIALAFFDHGVDNRTKRQMRAALRESFDETKRIQMELAAIPENELHDFVTKRKEPCHSL